MTDTKEIKEKLKNGEEVSVSEIFSKNEQSDDLDKLEELALKSIEKSKEDHEKQILKRIKERQEESIRFYQVVKENKIEEVKDLIAKDCAREEYYDTCEGYRGTYVGIRLDVPSAEMAQILIDDARQSDDKSSDFEEALICKCIELHPEKFSDWDRLARHNKISYEFKTRDINAFERCVKAGLSPKCYDFDAIYRGYVEARDGFKFSDGSIYPPKPEYAAQLKKELLTAITIGYPVDKSFASLEFIQGIREEREQKEAREREKQEIHENFEAFAEKYYQAKNGYYTDYETDEGLCLREWYNPDEAEAAQLKQRLKNALEDGHQVDASNENSKSAWFVKELQEEQKTGNPYRRNDEYYIRLEDGKAIGECKVPLDFWVDKPVDFQMIEKFQMPKSIKSVFHHAKGLVNGTFEKEGFTGEVIGSAGDISIKAQYQKGQFHGDYEEQYKSDGIIKAQYQEGKLHGAYKELNSDGTVYLEQYYENGVDVTEKRKALQRIADGKIRKENNLKKKNLPKALEELGKAQIKFNSKIEAAFAVKKAQKEGRK